MKEFVQKYQTKVDYYYYYMKVFTYIVVNTKQQSKYSTEKDHTTDGLKRRHLYSKAKLISGWKRMKRISKLLRNIEAHPAIFQTKL